MSANLDGGRSRSGISWLARLALSAALVAGCTGGEGGGEGPTEDEAVPGEATAGVPTARCIGVRWEIAEDANANGVVEVYYRKSGVSTWSRAMDLKRVQRAYMHFTLRPPSNAIIHAGSVFDLEEDTDYELRLVLTDSDGGGDERILTARTWKEPGLASPSRTLHVIPGSGGGSGTSGDPFRGLEEADAAAEPGDLFLLHDGTYLGSFTVSASGEESSPIVWQAAAGESPVLDANGGSPVLRVEDAHDLIFEGLELCNADWGVILRRSQRVTFRRLYIHGVQMGIDASVNGTNRHLWMSDNLLEGGVSWPRSATLDWRGITVAGEGIVVCHNRVLGWWDGIDVYNYHPSRDIDIYLNDISECTDDGIELDFSDANTRAFENRLTNCHQGVSFQPVYGGPAYAVRNSLYNVAVEPFKLHNAPSGAVILHNTVLRDGVPMLLQTDNTIHNVLVLNNLFVARAAPYAIDIKPPKDACLFDYDVYCGGPYNNFGKWGTDDRYSTLALFAAGTGMETNGVHSPGYGALFVSGAEPPSGSSTAYPLSTNDLRPSAFSPAVDAGCVLYNLNDAYAGSAPDAGCLEAGSPLPAYGPR